MEGGAKLKEGGVGGGGLQVGGWGGARSSDCTTSGPDLWPAQPHGKREERIKGEVGG